MNPKKKREKDDYDGRIEDLEGQLSGHIKYVFGEGIKFLKTGLVRIESTERDVRTIEQEVNGLKGAVTQMSQTISSLASAGTRKAGQKKDADQAEACPQWATTRDPQQATEWLTAVDEWVREVWLPYAETDKLPACWAWHSQIVQELLVCRHYWQWAWTHEDAKPRDRSDWMLNRSQVEGRLGGYLGCTDGLHSIKTTRYAVDDLAVVDGKLAEWWARTHGEVDELPPGLIKR